MKKIKLFLYNVKNSWFFLLVIIIELVLCMTLLAIALTNFLGENNRFAYYNKAVENKSFVTFEGYSLDNDIQVQTISKYLGDDLSTLATTINIGSVQVWNNAEESLYLTIATPALCANFNSKGLKFSKNLESEYREAYVAKAYSEYYKTDKMYDISVENDGEIYKQKIKIVGYIEDGKEYYSFSSGDIYFRSLQMVVCDELPQFANLSSGIFINDKTPEFYKNLGFKALTVREYYDYQKESSPFMIYLYLAIIIMLFSFVTILCNYVLSVDKLSRRNASLFVCGSTNKASIATEGKKMLFAYLIAVVVGISIASLMVFIGTERQNIIVTMSNFYLSALIIFGLYVLAVVIGFVKFVRAKPLKVLGNMKK